MAKVVNPYSSKGIGKSKEIRRERKKPLPIALMSNAKWMGDKEKYLKEFFNGKS